MAYKGGARKKATLKYAEDLYTPAGLQALTDKQIRTEYSRLRSIGRKRLERFKGTEWETTQVYKYNKDKYKALPDMKNDSELRHILSDLARFITSEQGSVRGLEQQRKKAVATLNENGYDFVNLKNFRDFGDFMEYSRMLTVAYLYDSERLAEFYETIEKKNLTKQELQKAFMKWHKNNIKKDKVQNKNKKDSKQYRQALE